MAKCEKLFQTEVTTHMAVCDPRQRGAAVALSVERIHRTKSVWLVCGNGKLPCNRRVHNEKHFTRLFVCLLVFCSVCWQRFGEFNSRKHPSTRPETEGGRELPRNICFVRPGKASGKKASVVPLPPLREGILLSGLCRFSVCVCFFSNG